MLKKYIAITLVITAVLSLVLTGCGHKGRTNTAESTTAQTSMQNNLPAKIKVMTFDTMNPDYPISKGLPVMKEFEKACQCRDRMDNSDIRGTV